MSNTKHTTGPCANCGADRELHHYQTLQCPVGGREETREGRKQEWMALTFLDESSTAAKLEEVREELGLLTIDRNTERTLRFSCEDALKEREKSLAEVTKERDELKQREEILRKRNNELELIKIEQLIANSNIKSINSELLEGLRAQMSYLISLYPILVDAGFDDQSLFEANEQTEQMQKLISKATGGDKA